MKSKNSAIIQYLIENKNEELSILAISKNLKMDYKNIYFIIKRLENELLIKLEHFGQSNRVKLIPQMHPLIFEAEYNRKDEVLKNKNLAVMLKDIKSSLTSSYFILLLFGSYTKKKQNKKSDIDLMFIVSDDKEEQFEKEVKQSLTLLPLPIHYLVFSEQEFLEMISAKELNVGKEALKYNIILYGIELFYELMSKN